MPADTKKKARIVAEVIGIVWVNLQGLLVVFLGFVKVFTDVSQEDGIVAEGNGIAWVNLQGLPVVFLGPVMVFTDVRKLA